jgi:hypothetical protein
MKTPAATTTSKAATASSRRRPDPALGSVMGVIGYS